MKCRIPSNGPSNRNEMMKQMQKMQNDMAALQEDLENREYIGTAGGNSVSITVDGKHLVKKIEINKEIVDPDDTEMLEDLLTVAFNAAVTNATDIAEKEMGAITGGLNIPGLF